MINKEELEKNIGGIKEEIKELFLRLSKIESNRLNYFHQGEQALSSFAESTQESISVLNQFEALFLRLMGYVILVKEKGHKDPFFQELLMRNKIIERQLIKVVSLREKQIKIAYALPLASGIKLKYLRWRLQSLLGKERNAVQLIRGAYHHNQEKVAAIKKMLDDEETKHKIALGVAGAAWLVPVAGTALFGVILIVYDWANQFSDNYTRLTNVP
ncbi:hypothetical protein HZC30_07230 [Candidatus Woesearchaeota archaeon]|nr:hypothetical protein [Candidatus Woesearchaeota archaeon]